MALGRAWGGLGQQRQGLQEGSVGLESASLARGCIKQYSEAVRFWLHLAGRALRAPSQPVSPRAAAPGKRLSVLAALCWAPSSCLETPLPGDGSALLVLNSAPWWTGARGTAGEEGPRSDGFRSSASVA